MLLALLLLLAAEALGAYMSISLVCVAFIFNLVATTTMPSSCCALCCITSCNGLNSAAYMLLNIKHAITSTLLLLLLLLLLAVCSL